MAHHLSLSASGLSRRPLSAVAQRPFLSEPCGAGSYGSSDFGHGALCFAQCDGLRPLGKDHSYGRRHVSPHSVIHPKGWFHRHFPRSSLRLRRPSPEHFAQRRRRHGRPSRDTALSGLRRQSALLGQRPGVVERHEARAQHLRPRSLLLPERCGARRRRGCSQAYCYCRGRFFADVHRHFCDAPPAHRARRVCHVSCG